MTDLRQLLATWENWSARETLNRALAKARSTDSGGRLTAVVEGMPATCALEALRGSAKLVELLSSWRWQAMYAARSEGASWTQIGDAAQITAESARAEFAHAVELQEACLGRDVSAYRQALCEA